MRKMTQARKSLGWSVTKAAQMTGLSEQQLRNIERLGKHRPTIPARVTAVTMVKLLETYPSLDIRDFVAGTKLSVRRH